MRNNEKTRDIPMIFVTAYYSECDNEIQNIPNCGYINKPFGIGAFFVLLICFSTVYLCGCATILNGTSQKIPVSSEPIGATVQVDSKSVYTTPIKLRLERRRDHTLVFAREGYEGQTVNVMHVLSESVCGNTLLFGVLGWVFDIFAGTQHKLVPNKIHVELKNIAK